MGRRYSKNQIQIVWGAALVFSGVSVFLRMPYIMAKVGQVQQFSASTGSIAFCFYFMGTFLFFGGIKKIFKNLKKNDSP